MNKIVKEGGTTTTSCGVEDSSQQKGVGSGRLNQTGASKSDRRRDFAAEGKQKQTKPKKSKGTNTSRSSKSKGAIADSVCRSSAEEAGKCDGDKELAKTVKVLTRGEIAVQELKDLQAVKSLKTYERINSILEYGNLLHVPVGASPTLQSEVMIRLCDGTIHNNPLLKLCVIARDKWRHMLPVWVLNCYHTWVGILDPYADILSVTLSCYVIARINRQDERPYQDREEESRDLEVLELQPFFDVRLKNGEALTVFSDFDAEESYRKCWFFAPNPSTVLDLSFRTQQNRLGLEHYAKNVFSDALWRECTLVPRKILDHFGGVFLFKRLYLSSYSLFQFFQRRTLITPKMDQPTTVMRLIRMYAEDPCVDVALSLRTKHDISVVEDTMNVLVCLMLRDPFTGIQNF